MTRPVILDAQGLPMMQARSNMQAYEAADSLSSELAGWQPGLQSADAEWLGERDTIVGRVRDLVRNNGWAAGAVRRECEAVIGAQLRLNYRPNWKSLGQSAEWAAEFAREVEAAWAEFCWDPGFYADAERHMSVPALFGLAYRHYAVDGDALAVLLWREERRAQGAQYATVIQIVDPDRLSNPFDAIDDDRLRGGVELDEDGAALRYHIRKRHPFDVGTVGLQAYEWLGIDRDLDFGRPQVVHYFEKERAGETRGKSRFANVIEPLKMDHALGRAELGAAVLNAILAAFIESPFDPGLVEQGFASGNEFEKYQASRTAFHKNSRLALGGVKIKHLFPGEKFTMNAATRPNGAFEPFEMAVLRKVSAGLGLSYEQLTNDWSKVNYSSARAALLEIWRGFTARRVNFTQRFCTPIFAAWFEEALDRGVLRLPKGAPDFYQARAAWCRCQWIGPARGWVDPTKEAQAAVMRIDGGFSTLQQECAEQGLDWEEVAEQQARERAYRAGLNLPELQGAAKGPAQQVDETPSESEEEEKA